ncbi:MAG TPA: hypothetical protein VGI60_14165 [Chthoniobacterales bacterium]
MNKCHVNTELSSLDETCCQFNGGQNAIKLGIDVRQRGTHTRVWIFSMHAGVVGIIS